LDVEDLKNFRLSSFESNALVEKSETWADAVFVYDETKHKISSRECPKEVICADKTLGWPSVRLKNVTKFSYQFWKDVEVRASIRSLEMKDCCMAGSWLFTLIVELPHLEEFSFIMSDDSDSHVAFETCKKLEMFYDTRKKQNTLRSTQKKTDASQLGKAKKLDSSGMNLKKFEIEVGSIPIANTLLDIIDELQPKSLEELIIRMQIDVDLSDMQVEKEEPTLLSLPTQGSNKKLFAKKESRVNNIQCKPKPRKLKSFQLRARSLIERNQRTLKVLEISVNEGEINDEFAELQFGGCPSMYMVNHLFKEPDYPNLSLKELTVELPNLIPSINHHTNNKEDDCAHCCFRTLISFCRKQKSLQYLKLGQAHLTSANRPCLKLLQKLRDERFPKLNVKLGGTIYAGNLNAFAPKWEDLNTILSDLDLQFSGNEKSAKTYQKFINDKIPRMDRMKRLEIRSESKGLMNFEALVLKEKFPNLTKLLLADVRERTDGLKNAPKIDDQDLQRIIQHLPRLVQLVIKANMSEVTDYGLTGLKLPEKPSFYFRFVDRTKTVDFMLSDEEEFKHGCRVGCLSRKSSTFCND
jgi:hypothetical protein